MKVGSGMITAYEIDRVNNSANGGSVRVKFTGMNDAVRGKSGSMEPLFKYVSPGGTKYMMWSASYPAWSGWKPEVDAWCLALPGTQDSRDDESVTLPLEHWQNVMNMIGAYNTKMLSAPPVVHMIGAYNAKMLSAPPGSVPVDRTCQTCGYHAEGGSIGCKEPRHASTGESTCCGYEMWIPRDNVTVVLNYEPIKCASLTFNTAPVAVAYDERPLTEVLK